MLYLLYGPDTYRRDERLAKMREAYRAKNPEALGETVLDGTPPLEHIEEVCTRGRGIFEAKRFIVIHDAFVTHGKALVELIDQLQLHQQLDLNLVVVEGDVEKNPAFPALRVLCRADAFAWLAPQRLRAWIVSYVKARGSENGPRQITPRAVDLLVSLGPDLRRLSNELEKLLLFAAGKETLTEDDVKALSFISVEETIFPLSDGVCEKQPLKALVALLRLTADGSEPDGLISYTIGEARNLVRARAALSAQKTTLDIAQEFGTKPFVWKKRLAQARKWQDNEVVALLERIAALDLSWKTGAEKRLALDHFILLSAKGRDAG